MANYTMKYLLKPAKNDLIGLMKNNMMHKKYRDISYK